MADRSGRTPDVRQERIPAPVEILNPVTSGAGHAKRGLMQLLAALPKDAPDRLVLLHAMSIASRLVASSGR